jgi:putative DNA primase/helicase
MTHLQTVHTAALPVLIHGIPQSMRADNRWLVWRYETRDGDTTKVPYQSARSQTKASSTDPSTWSTFDLALAAYQDGKSDGIGFALGDGYFGLDFDHGVAGGVIDADGQAMLDAVPTYAELSVSGTGLHLIGRGTLPPGRRRRGHIEAYDAGRYFTMSGHRLPDAPADVRDCGEALTAWYRRVFGDGNGHRPGEAARPSATIGDDDTALLERARRARNGAKFSAVWVGDVTGHGSHSEADQALCNLLAFWTGADAGRMDRLFRQSGLMREKWNERRGAQTYGEITIAKAIEGCTETYAGGQPGGEGGRQPGGVDDGAGGEGGRQGGHRASTSSTRPAEADPQDADRAPDGEHLILDPTDPLPSAKAFVTAVHTVAGRVALQHQSGVFYAYDAAVNAYRDHDESTVRSDLYRMLEPCRRLSEPKPGQPPTLGPFKPNKTKVEHVLDALRAVTNLPSSAAPPCWLQDDPGLDPGDILACRNGLLHIPTRTVRPPTPAFFTLQGLNFAYDPNAPAPEHWLRFLADLWPDEDDSPGTLQEAFGYNLTPRTHLQKILMLVGPKRSGKGTIARVQRLLLGERNCCGPTLSGLADQFGLAVLIDKSLAVISDARIGGRTDTAILTERLLSISGEDALSIPRKFLPDWTGKLPTRFWLLTNELPKIEDASGALASRFVVLRLTQSFFGREDHGLFDRLVPELPGILNWALEGFDRLYARGRFVQPASASELIQEFEDLGSPIGAFVRERCEVGRGFEVIKDRLFALWKTWCQETGRDRAGTIQTFGRNLRSAVPWLGESRPHVLGVRVRYFEGVRPREGAE